MPAASCRIMPARSISRCETISASFGVSREIGRKKRVRRIADGSESRADGSLVKADRPEKHKTPGCFGSLHYLCAYFTYSPHSVYFPDRRTRCGKCLD